MQLGAFLLVTETARRT